MIDRILQRFARAEQTGAPPLSSYAPEVLIGAGFDLGWATGVKELVRLQAADGVQLPMALAVALQEHLAYALLRARREAKEAK